MLTRMRIWLPDLPGSLAAVAAEIGAAGGNVVGLEVLEREAGVAIDELVVELPDDPTAVDAVGRGVRTVPGAGVELVVELPRGAPGREESVLAAAASILDAPTPTAAMEAMSVHLITFFDLSWLVLVDDGFAGYIDVHGEVPPVQWLAAFAEGSRSGSDPANDTTGSGVFIEPVPGTGTAVCGGRLAPIRRRERQEIALLAMVAARYVAALARRHDVPGQSAPPSA
jgi:hypothetical protein